MKKRLAKSVYLLGSGKGGVGKSTVTVNLACALANAGNKVGILDADLYGPSVPIMMGLRQLSPKSDGDKVIPFYKFGVQSMSVGFFIEEAKPIIWRGPVLHGILNKLVNDCQWGDLDYLLVDLPPGTGDIPISLSQLMSIDGAIIVTTPQEVAGLDAIKAINALSQVEIPLLGIVENMAGFQPPGQEETFPIFGEGQGEDLASRFETSLLGQIPLIMDIREGGDLGRPALVGPSAAPFKSLAERVEQLRQNPFMQEQSYV